MISPRPERLTNLLRRVPDLQVVAAHFGGWNIWPQSLAHPQPESVLYDTSSTLGMTDRDIVLRLIDKIGPDRLIFRHGFPDVEPEGGACALSLPRPGRELPAEDPV